MGLVCCCSNAATTPDTNECVFGGVVGPMLDCGEAASSTWPMSCECC